MIYLKLTALVLWMIICVLVATARSLFRWGDLNLSYEFAQMWTWGSTRITGFDLQVEARHHLDNAHPCVVVSNHQSAIDMTTFGSLYPRRTVVIGKREILYIPFFGLMFASNGHILINRKDKRHSHSGISQAVERIVRDKVSVWIFPEGTRNRSGEGLLPFKKGAFHLAIGAQVPIVPIVCQPIHGLINWGKKRMIPGVVRLKVLPPIPTTGMTVADVDALLERTRSVMLTALTELSATAPKNA